MRSTAALHGCDLARLGDIADVEDAYAAESLAAHRGLVSLRAAVKPAPSLLHRHEQQVPVHRHISLPARADHRCEQLRVARLLDVVDGESMETAHEQVMPVEGHVGVAEIEAVRSGRIELRAPLRGILLLALARLRFCWRRSAE